MHDPTEGGLAGALWEMADASKGRLEFDPGSVLIPELPARVCRVFGLDPLATIASGALLLAVAGEDATAICAALRAEGIACAEIGRVADGEPGVWLANGTPYPRPARDEIARVYEQPAQP